MFNLKTVTNKLILLNLCLYLITLLVPGLIYKLFALHTFENKSFFWYQIVSYQFIHDTGPLHILFNMMILYVFGSMVERHYGSSKLLYYYLFSGVIAGLLHNLTISDELILYSYVRNQDLTLVGASGSIWGILALFTFLYPEEKLYLFFTPVGIRTKYLIPCFFAIEILSAFITTDNISHFAHVGGALSGITLFYLDKKNLIK